MARRHARSSVLGDRAARNDRPAAGLLAAGVPAAGPLPARRDRLLRCSSDAPAIAPRELALKEAAADSRRRGNAALENRQDSVGITASDGWIEYEISGKGRPIVLLHGFPTPDGRGATKRRRWPQPAFR